MSKKLREDKNFNPCPVETEDEIYANGIFEFNITKLLDYIQKNSNKFPLEEVEVSNFYEGFSSINESHIGSVDIFQPVILAEISPERYNLIDGNHRMEKASRMGLKKIPAYRLNVGQHIKFITDKKAYVTYVEYWNSKL